METFLLLTFATLMALNASAETSPRCKRLVDQVLEMEDLPESKKLPWNHKLGGEAYQTQERKGLKAVAPYGIDYWKTEYTDSKKKFVTRVQNSDEKIVISHEMAGQMEGSFVFHVDVNCQVTTIDYTSPVHGTAPTIADFNSCIERRDELNMGVAKEDFEKVCAAVLKHKWLPNQLHPEGAEEVQTRVSKK